MMLGPHDMPAPRARYEHEPWPRMTHRAREQRSDYDDYSWPDDQPRRSRRSRITAIIAAAAIAWAILAFGGQFIRSAIVSAPAPVAMPPATTSSRGPVGAGTAPTAEVFR